MKYLKYILHLFVGIIILIFLFTQVPFKSVAPLIGQADIRFVLIAFIAGILSVCVNAFRWHILLSCLGCRYKFTELLKITFITLFFNVYLPSGVVGDFARVSILPESEDKKYEKKEHLTRTTASVVADRLAGLLGLMLLSIMGMFSAYRFIVNTPILPIFIALILIICLVFIILFSRRAQKLIKKIFSIPLKILNPVKAIIKDFTETLFIYRDNYAIFNKVIPVSVISNMFVVLYFFMSAKAINVNVNIITLMAFVPIIEFISAIPVSVGGVGVREFATILLFSFVGISAAKAMSISLLSFIVVIMLGLIGGALFILGRNKRSHV